jgi:2-dehydro-3-deoxyphosphooctonate aldolase (KDO 8-P synthase)
MAKAGVSVGADGIFLEVHDNPSKALSDKSNSLIINKLKAVLATCLRMKRAIEGDSTPIS